MKQRSESQKEVRHVRVDAERAGQRVDNFLLGLLKGVPKSHVYRLLRRGEVRVNRRRVKPPYRLQFDDLVRVPPVATAKREPHQRQAGRGLRETLEASILHEDQGLMVINKPAHLAVHGGSGLSFGVIEVLRACRPDAPHLELVHRLDRETSGCLLLAKKRSALRVLHEFFRANRVQKTYLALGTGRCAGGVRTVNLPLKKNILQSGERLVKVDPKGKPSRTRFRCVEHFSGASLLEARPLTGRTHQIRVHAAHLGHPLAGDEKYGDAAFNRWMRGQGLSRLFLHAASLVLPRLEGEGKLTVSAPLPAELEAVLENLRKDVER